MVIMPNFLTTLKKSIRSFAFVFTFYLFKKSKNIEKLIYTYFKSLLNNHPAFAKSTAGV
jgi:hypothetical protein